MRGLLWSAATIIVALIAVYLFSFVLFVLHENGIMFAPMFGWMGIMMFIVSSPWLLIGVVGAFLGLLYVLVSQYSFSYRKPLVYSMIGLVAVVIAVSALIQQLAFHERAGEFARRHDVPGFAPMYRNVDNRPPKDITRGSIFSITETGFSIVTETEEEFFVAVNERTKLPRSSELAMGDQVFVFGPVRDSTVEAFGVMIDDGSGLPPPPADGERVPPPPKEDVQQ